MEGTIKIKKEKKVDNWHRKSFDREKDAILLPRVSRDMGLLMGTQVIEKEGQLIGKRKVHCGSIPIRPKTFGNRKIKKSEKKRRYLKNLQEYFTKNKKDLEKFQEEKELLVYICFYLRERSYYQNDLDNYIKVMLDALKKFIGDDNKIVCLIVEKKGIIGAEEIDLDFFEQSLMFISTPDAKQDLFQKPKYCIDFLGLINLQNEITLKGKLDIKKSKK